MDAPSSVARESSTLLWLWWQYGQRTPAPPFVLYHYTPNAGRQVGPWAREAPAVVAAGAREYSSLKGGNRPVLVRASELRLLDVVNIVDGRKLGYVYDVDVDVDTGRIRALLVPGEGRRLLTLFGRRPDVAIPWKRVRKIGVDVILVHLPDAVERE